LRKRFSICGPKIENGVYRRRYNHELDGEFDSPNALNVMKTSRFCYVGHKKTYHKKLYSEAEEIKECATPIYIYNYGVFLLCSMYVRLSKS
jgi:hypothetical protein